MSFSSTHAAALSPPFHRLRLKKWRASSDTLPPLLSIPRAQTVDRCEHITLQTEYEAMLFDEPEVVCPSFTQLGRRSPTAAAGNFLFLVSLLPPSPLPLPLLLPAQRSTWNAPVIDEVHRLGTNRWGRRRRRQGGRQTLDGAGGYVARRWRRLRLLQIVVIISQFTIST